MRNRRPQPFRSSLSRRDFLARGSLLAGAALTGAGVAGRSLAQATAPGIVTSDRMRPQMPSGVQSGDVTAERGIVWSRTDRPARLIVEWATDEKFTDLRRVVGPAALETSDYTARVDLAGLPPGERIFYRAMFQDLGDLKTLSEPLLGSLKTAPAARRDITFVFSGDEAGQGWGINSEWGGMRLYSAMLALRPDFFIHSGDQIYADGPIVGEVKLDDGRLWKNVTTEAKSHVAQSLADYRGAFAYNLLDANKRTFAAEVPFLVQWDDHEVRNNWYPGEIIRAPSYDKVRSASELAAFARQAMFEYAPYRFDANDPERIYRAFRFGPLLDVFMLDERSYRGPNSANRQPALGPDAAFLGTDQLAWLKRSLLASRATWKVIASDMPISIVVPDANPDVPKGTYEAWANADDGPPLGRELEIANLLSFLKNNAIRNVVFVTADVHYASATEYHPTRARFTDFDPFWEFVGGPINAGTFGPNPLDRTFGPDVKFVSIPADLKQNRPPSEGYQFFGSARIDAKTAAMTVALHGIDGRVLWKMELPPTG